MSGSAADIINPAVRIHSTYSTLSLLKSTLESEQEESEPAPDLSIIFTHILVGRGCNKSLFSI